MADDEIEMLLEQIRGLQALISHEADHGQARARSSTEGCSVFMDPQDQTIAVQFPPSPQHRHLTIILHQHAAYHLPPSVACRT